MDLPLTPRLIRAVPPQLGTYFRPNRVDHQSLLAFLADGTPSGLEGIVFDPALDSIHAELRDEARERKIEAVLDTRVIELRLKAAMSVRDALFPGQPDTCTAATISAARPAAVLRSVLGTILKDAQPMSFSAVPEGKHIQTRRGA